MHEVAAIQKRGLLRLAGAGIWTVGRPKECLLLQVSANPELVFIPLSIYMRCTGITLLHHQKSLCVSTISQS